MTTLEFTEKLNLTQQTISDYNKKIGIAFKYSRRVPNSVLVLIWDCVVCFLLHEDELDRDLLFKADFVRLQAFLPEEGFVPADCITKCQRITIQPSPGIMS